MNLSDLEKKGGFVDTKLTKIPVEWKHLVDGEEEVTFFSIYIRKPSFAGFDRINSAERQGKSYCAMAISETVSLGEHGEERIPYDKAALFETSLAMAMLNAVEQNVLEEENSKKKNLKPMKKSGMN